MSEESNRTWQRICSSALNEPDPGKALPLLEAALCKLEKRFAEWGNDQGTEEELPNILKTIQALRARTAQLQKNAPESASKRKDQLCADQLTEPALLQMCRLGPPY